MVTWEFPPLVVGGLAAHVDGLSRALVRQGHEVVVLTLHHADVDDDYDLEGVRVLRARADLPWLPPENFVAQMASANHRLVQLSRALDGWQPDIVHAHDWLVAWAGDTLHALYGVPLVATMHATERGRNGGHVPPGQPAAIHAVEWWLTYQANRVIACSRYMVDEIVAGFDLPTDKIDEVPNGVDPVVWAPPSPAPVRGEGGPLVVTWGRLQYEKGFQYLIEAMASLRRRVPGVHLVIAGRGSYLAELEGLAQFLGVADIVEFAGFVPDPELRALLHRGVVRGHPVALRALRHRRPRGTGRRGSGRGRRRGRHGRGPGGHGRRAAGATGRCRVTLVRRRAVAHRTGPRRVVTSGRHPAGRGAVLLGRHRHSDRRDVAERSLDGRRRNFGRFDTPRLASQAYEGAPQLQRSARPCRSRWPRSSGWP